MTPKTGRFLMALRPRTGLCIGFWSLVASVAHAAGSWPVIATPPNVSSFSIGEKIFANGMPMRLRGFVAGGQDVTSVADWFRRSLGQPLVENRHGDKLILGRAQNGYYLTVQIEPAGTGSRGVLAVGDVKSMNETRARYVSDNQRWLDRWPSGSRLLNDMTSEENGRITSQRTVTNGHGESFNRDALVHLMAQDGFVLERETAADAGASPRMPAHLHAARALFFKGKSRQAVATISRDAQGGAAVVLQTTVFMETHPQ